MRIPSTLNMKGIEKLTQITDEQRKLLAHSANQYKRFARIYIEVLGVKETTVTVKVSQQENNTEKYLSAKELKERVHEVFEGCLPSGWDLEVRAVPFRFLEVITIEYIREKQTELGLSDIDLSRLLGVRRENLSRIFNDKRGLTKLGKAAFYYLFKYLEK